MEPKAEPGKTATARYILVYPQGCDVCNHLSLFLCVADYDKLLPGLPTRSEQTLPAAAGRGRATLRAQRGC